MVRFWRPAIITAVSSSGIRANSVRQRLYSPCRDGILRAAVVDGLGPARLAAEADSGASSAQDAAICPLSPAGPAL